MKTPAKLMALLFIILLISPITGCKKDKDDDKKEKVCLLTSLSMTYTEEYPGEIDTETETLQVTYDSEGRLTKWQWSPNEYYLFVYSANGKLEKVREFYEGSEYGYILFTWEANKVTRQWYWKEGSTFYPSYSKRLIHFNANNEITLVEGFYKDYDEVWAKDWYDVYTWQNGNITKIEEYYSDYYAKSKETMALKKNRISNFMKTLERENKGQIAREKSSVSDYPKAYTITFTYDTKKNPFSPHQALVLFELDWLFMSKNNITSFTEVDEYDGEEWYFGPIQYEYNTEDYPITLLISFSEPEEGYSASFEWEFNYTCN